MIGEVIRVARIANDMTSSSLSDSSSVSKSYITEIEQGKKIPSKSIINKLANALNLKAETLYAFDKYHTLLLESRKELYIYRSLLMAILEVYNTMDNNTFETDKDFRIDNYSKRL